MWLWGILALLSVTAYGQVDHSSRWGENKGSLNSYWGIKSGFPSYGIYDQENLNFGSIDDEVKVGRALYTAISYQTYLGYVDFSHPENSGKYIIDKVLPVLDPTSTTFGSNISRYFRSPASTLADAAVSRFYNGTSEKLYMLDSFQYTLYKYRNYQYPIKDLGTYGANTISDTSINSLIILIHGHNNSSVDNPYANDISWISLRTALQNTIAKNPNWKVIGYDWAEDASNGSALSSGATGFLKSAGVAHYHGIHLAESLKSQFPSLQKVHFITHSAGLWVARSACVKLNGTIKTQVTALDPFLPTKIQPTFQLNSDQVSVLSAKSYMYRLENYYVIDSNDSDILYGATSGDYTMPGSKVLNLNLGGESIWAGQPANFGGTFTDYIRHSGPIQWYSDSVDSLGKKTSTELFIPFKNNESQYGWSKSIFMNEPHILSTYPTSDPVVVAPGSTTVISTSSKSLNNELNLIDANDPIQSSWQFKDASMGQWNPQSATSSAVQFHASTVKGSYILRYTAYNNAGSDMRDITIRVRSYYEQWAEVSNGLTGSSADALSDISGNGVPNIIKFALGKTPGDKSIPQYNTSTLTSNSKKYLKISVPRSSKPTGVSIVPEVSSDLQTWKSSEAQTLTDTASEYSAQDLVPMDSATRRFIRLRFTEQ
jgi:hypothetical protein